MGVLLDKNDPLQELFLHILDDFGQRLGNPHWDIFDRDNRYVEHGHAGFGAYVVLASIERRDDWLASVNGESCVLPVRYRGYTTVTATALEDSVRIVFHRSMRASVHQAVASEVI